MTTSHIISKTSSTSSPTRSEMMSSFLPCFLAAVVLSLGPSSTDARSHHQVFFQSPTTLTDNSLLKAGSSNDISRSERLMQLLNMRNSMNNLLHAAESPSNVRLTVSSSPNNDNTGDISDIIAKDGELQPAARKRIFCNGFTGCGGRFRKQRRQDDSTRHSNEKRVFCNSHGCSSMGRKRAAAGKSKQKSSSSGLENMGLWLEAMRRIHDFERMQSQLRTTGCSGPLCSSNQERLPDLGSAPDVVDGSQRSPSRSAEEDDLLSDMVVTSGKRFFSGSTDAEWDAINDALR